MYYSKSQLPDFYFVAKGLLHSSLYKVGYVHYTHAWKSVDVLHKM